MTTPNAALLPSLIDIALEAGAEILAIYARDFTVEYKADESPLTEADLRAEAIILARLAALAPDIPVVAEEAAAKGEVPQIAARFFLVDPLDGSKEFVSRNGEFTVNIALIEAGVPVAGVVYAPALATLWWGDLEGGAFVAEVADHAVTSTRSITCVAADAEGLRVVGSRSHPGEGEAAFLAGFTIRSTQAAGSSLKFCLLADGRADLYPRFGRTMEWDTAAGDAVLRAAGGSVETLDAVPLAYGKRDQGHDVDFANPHFIARSTRR